MKDKILTEFVLTVTAASQKHTLTQKGAFTQHTPTKTALIKFKNVKALVTQANPCPPCHSSVHPSVQPDLEHKHSFDGCDSLGFAKKSSKWPISLHISALQEQK